MQQVGKPQVTLELGASCGFHVPGYVQRMHLPLGSLKMPRPLRRLSVLYARGRRVPVHAPGVPHHVQVAASFLLAASGRGRDMVRVLVDGNPLSALMTSSKHVTS